MKLLHTYFNKHKIETKTNNQSGLITKKKTGKNSSTRLKTDQLQNVFINACRLDWTEIKMLSR